MIPVSSKLVGLCKDSLETEDYKKFQLPVVVEEMRTMIIQFGDPCKLNVSGGSAQPSMSFKQFCHKLSSLTPSEMIEALSVDNSQFTHLLTQMVPCIGCRKSVEKLYSDLTALGMNAIEPMVVNCDGVLSLPGSVVRDPKLLYKYLILNGNRFRSNIDILTKCRRNRRCQLHSLDVQSYKVRPSWTELWKYMSDDCKDECCIVETDNLIDMLEAYLQKHRFCGECRTKVMRAYSLLVADVSPESEPNYKPAVYQGLHYCAAEQHLHIKTCEKFLNTLIARAEPELFGSSRERHAKTIEIAQNEVVTCLGLYMYDRLHRMQTALKSVEQTFHLMYYTGVIALYNNFQMEIENKHGLMSRSLEDLCAELKEQSDCCAHSGSLLKSAKGKKGKKQKQKSVVAEVTTNARSESSLDVSPASSINGDPLPSSLKSEVGGTKRVGNKAGQLRSVSSPRGVVGSPTACPKPLVVGVRSVKSCKQEDIDAGYASASPPVDHSPVKGVEEVLSRPVPFGQQIEEESKKPITLESAKCSCTSETASKPYDLRKPGGLNLKSTMGVQRYGSGSLLEMLQRGDKIDSDDCECDGEPLISPKYIEWYAENQSRVTAERSALREKLKKKFDEMQARLSIRVDNDTNV